MNIEETLEDIDLNESTQNESLDNFFIVFNRKSDTIKHIMSEIIKNRFIRNGILDGTINIKLSKNDYTVITRKL